MSDLKKKVIVIDDDQVFCELVNEILLGQGFEVRMAGGGEEGIALAQSGADMIVLDIFMQNMDGWRVLERLKTDEKTRSIPVLLCSVRSTVQAAREHGAADYVRKPFTVDHFSKKVRQVLTHAG